MRWASANSHDKNESATDKWSSCSSFMSFSLMISLVAVTNSSFTLFALPRLVKLIAKLFVGSDVIVSKQTNIYL